MDGGIATREHHDTQPDHDLGPPPPPPPAPRRARLGWLSYAAVAVVAVLATTATLAVSGLAAQPATTDPGDAVAPAAQDPPVPLGRDATLYSAIAEQVSPSVVRVDAANGAAGSGVIYAADGVIITNFHVVEGARDATVTLPSGERHDADIVGDDQRSDIAVLRIEADGLPVPAFADQAPDVGDITVAIGSPFGLNGSVTQGIVSALDRTVSTPGGFALVDMIQTDAAINPGNSGGALVNGDGAVIGINTAIASTTGASVGIGFAIPIRTAAAVADQLQQTGEVEHAFLGIAGQTVDPDVAELYELPADAGAVLAEVVPDSPAADAGLRRGDIVVAIDGEQVDSMATLAGEIQRRRPGDDITLTVVREDGRQDVTVTLGRRPEGSP